MELTLVIILGAMIGSFLSMVSYRLPLNHNLIIKEKRSFCPKCQHVLGWQSLIPLLSFILQQGRCKYCNTKIPIRYPLIELTSIAIFTTIYLLFGINVNSIILLTLSCLLLVIIVTDLEHYIIPDIIQILMLITGIIYVLFNDFSLINRFLSGLLYMSIGCALYYSFLKIVKKEALGFGDIKFMGIAGIFLGFGELNTFLLLSGLIGTTFGFAWTKITKNEIFPFGPALAIALLLCLLGLNNDYILSLIL